MEHAPLDPPYIDFINRLDSGPIELSIAEQRAQGIPLLGQIELAGYATAVQTYSDPDQDKWRYTWTRTAKPLP